MLLRERGPLQEARQYVRPDTKLHRTLLIAPVGAKCSGLRAADVLAFGFGIFGLLRDDTSVSPTS